MSEDDRPRDADRLDGVAHPRETARLFGQEAALAAFDAALASGRLHHAWLLAGPRGVGKATAAYAMARRLLIAPGADVAAEEAPLRAGAHPRLLELRRGWNDKTKRFRGEIVIDDVRRLTRFFGLSATDGGWRVALVDPADDLNIQSANALLKALEEPPAKAIFLLTAHAPGRLPPTIRSRCRRLDFRAVSPSEAAAAIRAARPELDETAAAELARISGGAPGEALRLEAIGGLEAWGELAALHRDLPRLDRPRLDALMGSVAGRAGAERFELLVRLWPMLLERLAVAGARLAAGATATEIEAQGASPEIVALAERLVPSARAARRWAEAASDARDRLEAARGLNLDPERTILDTALMLEETASAARSA